MHKLTQEQVKFIDDRLELMGAKFMDIRYEMVDHIASAMEEMDGDFEKNFKEYYVLNRNQLISQYKRATRWRMLRALKLFWKTLIEPVSLVLFTGLFVGIYILTQFAKDTHDLAHYAFFPLMALYVPLFWMARENKKVSILRSAVQLYGAFCCLYLWSKLISDIIINRGDSIEAHRFLVALSLSAMVIQLIAIYRCRKQYAGKYI